MGVDGDNSRQLQGLSGVDGQQAGMGVGATHNGSVKNVLDLDVVGVGGPASEESGSPLCE